MSGHAGRLLVATPLIGDPMFERTVILLLEHTPDGAFGVVLNRPSDVSAEAVAPDWTPFIASPQVVFVGGPVRPEAVLGLARVSGPAPDGVEVLRDDLACVDLHGSPVDVSRIGDLPMRLYAGSAGWARGQLDDELREGAWWPVDVRPSDVLTENPDSLWAEVLRRQHGVVAWFANCPPDPSFN